MSHKAVIHHYTIERKLSNLLNYTPDKDFDRFLVALKENKEREWNWLIAQFRQRLLPFLGSRTQSYPSNALLDRGQFLEEVIEETLLQFYQIFKKGSFSKYSDLEATVITTAGFKLKEGFARLKKEQKMYFMEDDALNAVREKRGSQDAALATEELERIALIKNKLNLLETGEKELLIRYFNGEELQDIAQDLSISSAACRKRKQRIVEKLKSLIFKVFTLLTLLFI